MKKLTECTPEPFIEYNFHCSECICKECKKLETNHPFEKFKINTNDN